MVECSKCGKENNNTNRYCIKCGNDLFQNPALKYEKRLKLINIIFAFLTIQIILISISLVIIKNIFIFPFFLLEAAGAAQGELSSLNTINLFEKNLLPSFKLFLILIPVFIIINLIYIIKIRKINKQSSYEGKHKVNKILYSLLSLFLGFLGIHCFIIRDYKKGVVFLILTLICPLIANILGGISIFLYFAPLYSYSLAFSDFLIGLTKISNNGKIIL